MPDNIISVAIPTSIGDWLHDDMTKKLHVIMYIIGTRIFTRIGRFAFGCV